MKIPVYARAEWYRARPEAERKLHGRLVRNDAVAGPGGRAALRYRLVSDAFSYRVYDPDDRRELRALVGRDVVVWAKLVDLVSEGFGPELWIGAIRLRDRDAPRTPNRR